MIKVVHKNLYDGFRKHGGNDSYYNQKTIDKNSMNLITVCGSGTGGYYGICEVLTDSEKGNLRVYSINELCVVHNDNEISEREKYLTEVIKLLK